jgi:hypothetical protein
LHRADGIKAGLSEQQIAVLPAWREAPLLYDDVAQAALEIAELVTRLPEHQAADREPLQHIVSPVGVSERTPGLAGNAGEFRRSRPPLQGRLYTWTPFTLFAAPA